MILLRHYTGCLPDRGHTFQPQEEVKKTCEDSCQLLVLSPGLMVSAPGELPSHMASLDCVCNGKWIVNELAFI